MHLCHSSPADLSKYVTLSMQHACLGVGGSPVEMVLLLPHNRTSRHVSVWGVSSLRAMFRMNLGDFNK